VATSSSGAPSAGCTCLRDRTPASPPPYAEDVKLLAAEHWHGLRAAGGATGPPVELQAASTAHLVELQVILASSSSAGAAGRRAALGQAGDAHAAIGTPRPAGRNLQQVDEPHLVDKHWRGCELRRHAHSLVELKVPLTSGLSGLGLTPAPSHTEKQQQSRITSMHALRQSLSVSRQPGVERLH
jgi:hypothetical protein